ncbi:MAG: hypothetical protein AB7G75_16940 [Candidatus Binatia bacterium]
MIDTFVTALRLPVQDLFSKIQDTSPPHQNTKANRNSPQTQLTANKLARHSAPQSFTLPTPVQELVGPWLPKLKSPPPTDAHSRKAEGHFGRSLWQAEKKILPSRVDRVWRITPTDSLAKTYKSTMIDGGFDLGLEVHAGSTKKDRTTNAVKGTARTRITLLPEGYLQQRLGKSIVSLGKDDGRGAIDIGKMRMEIATDGGYAINPNTGATKPQGEIAGTLSWVAATTDYFTHDPWKAVAFRWQPAVRWEGRSVMGETKRQIVADGLPEATFAGHLRGDLRLDFLSPRLVASGNYHYGQGLTDTQAKWDQAKLSWTYQLNSHVSLGGSFTHGKRSPNQQTEHGLKLELGVMF